MSIYCVLGTHSPTRFSCSYPLKVGFISGYQQARFGEAKPITKVSCLRVVTVEFGLTWQTLLSLHLSVEGQSSWRLLFFPSQGAPIPDPGLPEDGTCVFSILVPPICIQSHVLLSGSKCIA